MGILQVSVTAQDLKKFGLDKSQISFEELLDKISTELARQALDACQDIAERVGLSKMTLDEINAEIKTVRRRNA
jgi:tRNA A37 methylthiotransferase MiaB